MPDVVPWDFSQTDRVIDNARPALDRTLADIEARWHRLAAPRLPGRDRDGDEASRAVEPPT